MKKQKIGFDSFPLDCWGHILTFLNNPRDFLSVVLVVKNMWKYCQNLCPSSTKNIDFKIRELPSHSLPHVSTISFDSCEKNDSLTKKIIRTIDGMGNFFEEILRLCPNLLDITLITNKDGPKLYISYDGYFPVTQEIFFNQPNSSLKRVRIDCDRINLQFCPPLLANLETLELTRCSPKEDLLEERDVCASLSLLLDSMPRLKKLELNGWRLDTDLSSGKYLKDNLETLRLCEMHVTYHNEISDFRRIECIKIVHQRTISHLKSINLCPNLKLLQFDSFDMDLVSFDYSFHSLINLTELNIAIDGPSRRSGDTILSINNEVFPHLEILVFQTKSPQQTFRVIVDVHTLSEFYIQFWRKLEVTKKSYLKLKTLELLFVDKILKKMKSISLDTLENLKDLRFSDLYKEENDQMCIVGCKKLEIVKIYDCCIKEIQDCPLLSEIAILPAKGFFYNNPNVTLKMVEIEFVSKKDQSLFEFVNESVRNLDCEKMILSPFVFPDIIISGELFMKNLKIILISFQTDQFDEQYDSLYEDISIRISNFLFLEILCFKFKKEFPFLLSIKNLPLLKELDMGFSCLTSPKKSTFHLKDIPSCKELSIGLGYTSVRYPKIENVPIRVLHVYLSEIELKDTQFQYKLRIDDINFPFVEEIVVKVYSLKSIQEDTYVNISRLQRIGLIRGLERLRLIKIEGISGFDLSTFKKVEGIEVSKVNVEFLYEIEGSGKREKKVLSLMDYVEEMKNRDVLIEVDEY